MNPLLKIGFESAPTLLLKKYRRAINHKASINYTAMMPGLKDYSITRTDSEYAAYPILNPYHPIPELPNNLPQERIDEAV